MTSVAVTLAVPAAGGVQRAFGTDAKSLQGSPARPPTPDQLAAKLADCVAGLDTDPGSWTWDNAATTLRRYLP